jgi:hypothetical protein
VTSNEVTRKHPKFLYRRNVGEGKMNLRIPIASFVLAAIGDFLSIESQELIQDAFETQELKMFLKAFSGSSVI